MQKTNKSENQQTNRDSNTNVVSSSPDKVCIGSSGEARTAVPADLEADDEYVDVFPPVNHVP